MPATAVPAPAADAGGNDAAAEKLTVDVPAPGLYWLEPAVVPEVLYVLATGAWQLVRMPAGVVLRCSGAPKLARRLGLMDGDVIVSLEPSSLEELDSRGALTLFTGGERIAVTLRRASEPHTLRYRVGRPNDPRARLADLLALSLRRGRVDTIDRALVVAIGAAAEPLSRDPTLLLELLELPAAAATLSIDSESVDPSTLAGAIGSRASLERLEITADGQRVALGIVSGDVDSEVLADALRAAARRRSRETSPARDLADLSGGSSTEGGETEVTASLAGIQAVSDEHIRVERGVFDSWLADPGAMMRTVRVVPALVDGTAAGFKLYGIRTSSVLKALGFRNGDLVESINGHSFAGPEAALAAYEKLRKADELRVDLTRRGMKLTVRIELVDRL